MRSTARGSNTTWTWKAGGSWEPGYGLKIRGNYSKAVRAPNIGELFTPLTVGLTNLASRSVRRVPAPADQRRPACNLPCAGCTGRIDRLITDPTAARPTPCSAATSNLEPETAKTWTLGVVFQPEFLPRFSMSVDYYNIRVKDVIGRRFRAT